MKKILYLCILPLLFSCQNKRNVHSDKGDSLSKIPNSSVTSFSNVIPISDKNLTNYDDSYMLDFVIPEELKNPVYVLYTNPPEKFITMLARNSEEVTVIKQIPRKPTKYDYLMKIAPTYLILKLKSNNGKISKDSTKIVGFPILSYLEERNPKSGEIKYYYSESYGSDCCPVDLQLENSPTREEFVKQFENRTQKKIQNTYRELQGKEGESEFFYTLEGLANREYSRILNRETKKIGKIQKVYSPKIKEISTRMVKID